MAARQNRLNELTPKAWIKFQKSWFIHNPPARENGVKPHPAKFPETLAGEFVEFFTNRSGMEARFEAEQALRQAWLDYDAVANRARIGTEQLLRMVWFNYDNVIARTDYKPVQPKTRKSQPNQPLPQGPVQMNPFQ